MPNYNSDIWEHFDRKDEEYAICTYCDRSLSYKTTIANLKVHLRRHGICLESDKSKNKLDNIEEQVSDQQGVVEEEVLEEEVLEEVWEDSDGCIWEPTSENEISEEELSKEDILKVPVDTCHQKNDDFNCESSSMSDSFLKHFDIINDEYACCKHCNQELSYKPSILNTHIEKRHYDIFLLDKGKPLDDHITVKNRSNKSKIWDHFRKIDKHYAICNHCSGKFSYKTTTGNLGTHLRKKHNVTIEKETNDEKKQNFTMIKEKEANNEEDNDSYQQISSDSILIKSKLRQRKNFGRIWTHFKKLNDKYASCKYCTRSKLSYKTTSGNLSSHLRRSHPSKYLSYVQSKSETSLTYEDCKSSNDTVTPDKTISILKHFYKKDNKFAICKYCSLLVSYDGSTEQLNTHLRKSHTQIYMTLQINNDALTTEKRKEQVAIYNSDPDIDHDQDVTYDSDSDQNAKNNCRRSSLQIKTNRGMMEISTVSNESSEFQETQNKIDQIWDHFEKGDNKIANCRYCKKKLSYASSIDNLHWHLTNKHGEICLPQQDNNDEITKNMESEIWLIPSSKRLTSELAHSPNKKELSRKTGEIWTHFDKVDNTYATCRHCNLVFSYKSSTGNLTSHLRKSHTAIYMAQRTNNESDIVWICNDSTQLPVEESQPKRRKTSQNNIPMRQVEKRQPDPNILKLFVYDFQSFSIVEDNGFAAFVNSISKYSLPSKEEISNMIIALYEKTLTELKESVIQNVISVCLTTECWTNSQKKDYIAVTAHYLDINFELQSILLECTCLNDGRTSKILEQEIKRILNEWQLCTKVIFTIFDNSKNVEYAIENLGWNGYGCYSHALNLIFLHGLQPVEQLIMDVNRIIKQFKNSANAQEMLVSYQTRNSLDEQDPKDLIKDVSSHWSGTFTMLRKFVRLNEAIQYCMALDDVEWPAFSTEEWEIASQLCEVFETFEEVTSSILGDQYMSGSLVIIITNCLKTICEDFLEKEEYSHYKPEVKEVISNVNSDLTEKFSTLEYNKDFALCTLLDPRFKCYGFHDDNAYTDIKEHVQSLLIKIIDDNEGSIAKMEVDTDASISAWDRFDKILKQKKPRQNSSVKAERELQMYLDDDMMPRKNLNGHWNNPAEWWREHKMVYPNLSEIYRTKCTVVGTSVPWDRLYSEKGQVMRERRSNLKTSEVEKIVFLNANLDEKKLEDNHF